MSKTIPVEVGDHSGTIAGQNCEDAPARRGIPPGNMANGGLNKVVEEAGELLQVIAKQIAFPRQDAHPDGAGSLRARMSDEVADLTAALAFAREKFDLDPAAIEARAGEKLAKFRKWDAPTPTPKDELPEDVTCPKCGGNGNGSRSTNPDDAHDDPCDFCMGAGKVPPRALAYYEKQMGKATDGPWMECPACGDYCETLPGERTAEHPDGYWKADTETTCQCGAKLIVYADCGEASFDLVKLCLSAEQLGIPATVRADDGSEWRLEWHLSRAAMLREDGVRLTINKTLTWPSWQTAVTDPTQRAIVRAFVERGLPKTTSGGEVPPGPPLDETVDEAQRLRSAAAVPTEAGPQGSSVGSSDMKIGLAYIDQLTTERDAALARAEKAERLVESKASAALGYQQAYDETKQQRTEAQARVRELEAENDRLRTDLGAAGDRVVANADKAINLECAINDVRSALSRIEHEAAAARDVLSSERTRPYCVPPEATAWTQLPSGLWAWRMSGEPNLIRVQNVRSIGDWLIHKDDCEEHEKTDAFRRAICPEDFTAAREFMGWE